MRYIPDYGGLIMQKIRKPERIKQTNPERFIPGGFLYIYRLDGKMCAIQERPSRRNIEGALTCRR